jgi:hypothetical protein
MAQYVDKNLLTCLTLAGTTRFYHIMATIKLQPSHLDSKWLSDELIASRTYHIHKAVDLNAYLAPRRLIVWVLN